MTARIRRSASGTAWRAARDAAQSTADCQDTARHASFEVSLRSSAIVVRLDPVGVLGARPAVLAHERAVDRMACEHPGGGDSAFGGEIRSHALPSRLRSDSSAPRRLSGLHQQPALVRIVHVGYDDGKPTRIRGSAGVGAPVSAVVAGHKPPVDQ